MKIIYRDMKKEETKKTLSVAHRAFPFWYRLFIHKFKNAVVAEHEGKIAGGAAWHIINTSKGGFGYLDYGFTEKEYRGKGIGRETYSRVMKEFDKTECEVSGALVLCDNTASWGLLADNGYSPCNGISLIRKFGLFGAMKIQFESGLVFAPGAELWIRGLHSEKRKSTPSAIILFLLFTGILAILSGLRNGRGIEILPACFITGLFSIRLLISWLAAGGINRRLKFSFWQSGMFIPIIVLLSGGIFPLGGDFYPDEKKWNYKDFKKAAGLSALFSWIVVLIPAAILIYLKFYKPDMLSGLNGIFQWIFMLLIIHSIPIVFESWSGNRLLKWSKPLFGLFFGLSISALVLLII